MPQAARLGDPIGHTKPGDGPKGGGGGDVTGKIIGPCSGNVFTNGIKAARASVDKTVCSKHDSAPPPIATGSPTVFINGLPAARVSDKIACGAFITDGSPNVFIGGGAVQTDPVTPEGYIALDVSEALTMVEAGAAAVLNGPVADFLGSISRKSLDNVLEGVLPEGTLLPTAVDEMIDWISIENRGSSSTTKGVSAPLRGVRAQNDLRFKIGEKDFRIQGGTVEQQLLGKENFKKIFETRRGADMLKVLSERRSLIFKTKTEFVLDYTKTGRSDAKYLGDRLTIDPNYVEYQLTTAGKIPATLIRLMSHELGHAVYGHYDAGKGRMDNVRKNENPIMLELGMPERLTYE